MRHEVLELIYSCHVGQALLPDAGYSACPIAKITKPCTFCPKADTASCHWPAASRSLSGIGKNRYQYAKLQGSKGRALMSVHHGKISPILAQNHDNTLSALTPESPLHGSSRLKRIAVTGVRSGHWP